MASIFYDNCATCHRPGEIGDGYIYANSYKALVSDPFGYLPSIPSFVNSKLMPPWKADPNYHHYIDERILNDQQITLIDSFVAQVLDSSIIYDPGDTTLAPSATCFPGGLSIGNT